MLGRLVIEDVRPRTPEGYPAKAAVGERVPVYAAIFREGHDVLAARVRWRACGGEARTWQAAPLVLRWNDEWHGSIVCSDVGAHEFVVEAWTDRYATWRHGAEVKLAAGQDIAVELEEGARLLTELAAELPAADRPALATAAKALRDERRPAEERLAAGVAPPVATAMATVADPFDLTASRTYELWVDRPRALFGAWYEFFPRSEGGFAGASARLDAVARMGFDVVYLPPIHPIGRTARKGPGNTLVAGPEDVGSPWAIGNEQGGHTAIEPSLGDDAAFRQFVGEANRLGMEVALDYALQCSPDHPWVREHPEWFHHRPDGTIKYAENPPKKYQDIYPINFWPETGRQELWEACRQVLLHWMERGVRIFRVDNPHTKPFAFWEWVIPAVQREDPGVLFLAEAFTRPKVMAKLAEIGFSQSYTYFTWRTTRDELEAYLTEVTSARTSDYVRPNFWPNTPDILSGPLREGPPAAFALRFLLAATMVPSYGIYSGYELYENQPMSPANEEYLESEKYQLKSRDWDVPWSLAPFITRVNQIRRAHPAFAELRNVTVHATSNPNLLAWSKRSGDGSDTMLVVANLDPYRWHEGTLALDLARLGLPSDRPYLATDELTGAAYTWSGSSPYVRLDPVVAPGHVLSLRAL